jgi:HlyD family secretion protein
MSIAMHRRAPVSRVWIAAILGFGLAAGSDGRGDDPVSADPARANRIAAFGRLQPKDGLIRVAGPSWSSAVVAELLVEKGDWVEVGQTLALLDTAAVLEGRVARLEAELENAKAESGRHTELHEDRVVSDTARDAALLQVRVLEADLRSARAELARARVHAPIRGQVIAIHARTGERVGEAGILELGQTDEMYAVAEVYETDIAGVRVGQRAQISSPALRDPLHGTVEWITPKVGKADVLGTDPAAKADARVVEVEIRLDESEVASGLTNLQVDVEILP